MINPELHRLQSILAVLTKWAAGDVPAKHRKARSAAQKREDLARIELIRAQIDEILNQ